MAKSIKKTAKKQVPVESKMGRPRSGVPSDLKGKDEGIFAEHLLNLFELSGLSSDELAERIGTTRVAVNQYLSGKRIPHFRHWRQIATALGLNDVRELLPKMPITK